MDEVLQLISQKAHMRVLIDVKEHVRKFALAAQIIDAVDKYALRERWLALSIRCFCVLCELTPAFARYCSCTRNEACKLCVEIATCCRPWWLTAVCVFAEPLDWIVDWIVDKPWIQQFVGASMVGQHWMSFVDENATIDLSRAHAYDGPPLAYVVNNALLRTRLRTAGVTVMADCLDLNVSCAPDILDPIVAQSLHRHFDTSSIRDEH
jgi:hypothetical protein